MLKPALLISTLLCFVFSCFAQPGKIDADRPDQTEGAVTMPKKWIQFEPGFGKQRTNPTENEYQHPTLLSKYGITKKIEFRLITTISTITDYRDPLHKQKETGLSPVEVGTKIALWEEKKLLPKTTLLAHLVIPKLASKNLQANKLAPNFRLSMQHSISKVVGLGYNLGAEWDGYSNEPTWIYTFSPGFNIGENWYTYIEAFGSISKQNAPEHNIDTGIAYFVNNDLKLDLSGGFGISEAAPDWYIAIGASFRFKTGK
jgi:Putative MetA-pathway of phenol degradation